jgi:hypothetical protein
MNRTRAIYIGDQEYDGAIGITGDLFEDNVFVPDDLELDVIQILNLNHIYLPHSTNDSFNAKEANKPYLHL